MSASLVITRLDDLALLRESVALECKLAQGRDGKGALPEDFWPTYSAMANAEGGLIVLGVRERKGQFEPVGIEDVAKVRMELFNNLNNRQKVSVNLLSDADVREHEVDGCTLLLVQVPRAPRKSRPVYLTSNPFGHTYRRLNEGDRLMTDEEVKRMLADQVEDSRDDKILPHYELADLDMGTFQAYRQVFSNRDPGHPWNTLPDEAFLQKIGGWKRNRETGEQGLTLAGLLMFGQMHVIQDILPFYMLDYQERPEARTERRWVDRLTLDGKWSGNLYDFYRKVYLKLTADLKVPFQLEGAERQEETPVHTALREALVNVLVHADYSDRASVLVVKRPDMFGFRNPGLMRIPLEVALGGGEPDCRNRNLHKMFRFVGAGDQAGSGIPRIFQGWRSQHWKPPKLYESLVPYNQTLLELRMIDLFPAEVMADLRQRFAGRFDSLSEEARMALALAASEGTVNHARLCAVSDAHPVELSRTLQHLVQAEMLASQGTGRGVVYFLPGQEMPTPDDVFGPLPEKQSFQAFGRSSGLEGRSSGLEGRSSGLEGRSSGLEGRSSGLEGSSSGLPSPDEDGYWHSEQLSLPIISDLGALSPALRQQLEKLADEPRSRKKLKRDVMEQVIMTVCSGHFITLQALAELLQRQPVSLRNEYLSPMVREKRLNLAFPATPTHERQAYCTNALAGQRRSGDITPDEETHE